VITVVFDQEINSPAIASKADVDAVFAFTDPSGSVVSLGANYTGAYAWEPLDATVAVTTGENTVSTSGDVRSVLDRGDEIKIAGVVYRADLSGSYSSTAVTISPVYTGVTADKFRHFLHC
jgi:hypothetical protein